MKKYYSVITRRCLILTGLMVVLFCSCDKVKDWHDATDSIPPGPIEKGSIHVENLNGGAKITYTLPNDKDLMGVKAVYTLSNDNIKREVYASAHTNVITLEGYGDTDEHTVELFAVDNSGNLSLGTETVIKPLTPPIEVIRQTLRIQEIFDGVCVFWENELEKDIAVTLYIADSTGYYNLFDTYFSNRKRGEAPFRTIPSKLQKFKVEIRDRWYNYAQDLDAELTPLFAQQLLGYAEGQYHFFRYGEIDNTWSYRGDVGAYSGNFNQLWDNNGWENNRLQQALSLRRYYYADEPSNSLITMPFPMYFTIDMGRKVSLSRIEILMYKGNPLGNAPMMSVFEIWGTNDPKPVNEIGSGSKEDNLQYWTSWEEANGADAWKDDWEKIGTCQYVLPSGITKSYGWPASTLSAEDQEFISKGINYDMDFGMATKSFKYIRFYILETTGGEATDVSSAVQQLQISEIRFFGTYGD